MGRKKISMKTSLIGMGDLYNKKIIIITFLLGLCFLYIISCFTPVKEFCTCKNELCITEIYNFSGSHVDKKFNILNAEIKIESRIPVRGYDASYDLFPIFTSGYYFYDNAKRDYSTVVNYQNKLKNSYYDNNMTFSLGKIDNPISKGFLIILGIGFCLYFLYKNKYILLLIQIPALIDLAYRLYIIYLVK